MPDRDHEPIDSISQAAFLRGITLFNQGRYFESHEALELAWQASVGLDKTILQGLIQAAAALVHLQRGNPRGAEALHARAQGKLEAASLIWRDLNLGRFRSQLERFINAGLRGDAMPAPPRL